MTNLTIWGAGLPTPTPEHSKSLSRQQLEDHRAALASEVKIVLSAYFQPHEDAAIKAGQLAWWCDELEDWTREQVVYGLRQWNAKNPRLRPTPGDITSLLRKIRGEMMAQRQKAATTPQPEPQEERVSPERAAEIMREVGVEVRKFGNAE